jgi:hypothetical protein
MTSQKGEDTWNTIIGRKTKSRQCCFKFLLIIGKKLNMYNLYKQLLEGGELNSQYPWHGKDTTITNATFVGVKTTTSYWSSMRLVPNALPLDEATQLAKARFDLVWTCHFQPTISAVSKCVFQCDASIHKLNSNHNQNNVLKLQYFDCSVVDGPDRHYYLVE